MKKIFISGALTSDSSIGFLRNVRNMLQMGAQVRDLGCSTYVPCNDILMSLVGGVLGHHNYYEIDLEWLEVCDALIVVPGYKDSLGVSGELKKAHDLGIPIFYTIDELMDWLGINV